MLQEIQRQLPAEDLIYVADSAYAPYGDKPVEDIQERAFLIVEFLLKQQVKAIVVACNTATGVAVEALRARWTLPFVAIEPAVKPAAAATRTGIVGVLATRQTIASPRFARLAETWANGRTQPENAPLSRNCTTNRKRTAGSCLDVSLFGFTSPGVTKLKARLRSTGWP